MEISKNLRWTVDVSEDEGGDYFLALGQFHHEYTMAEHQLTCILSNALVSQSATSLGYDLTRAVLGGMRMSALKDAIKRVARVAEVPKPWCEFMDYLFAQLGEIQFLRDRISHYPTFPSPEPDENTWINTDYAAARERHKQQDLVVTPKILRMATWDIVQILDHSSPLISSHLKGQERGPPPRPSWRYKPSMLIRRRPKSSESPRRRKPPLPPSSE